MSKKQSPYMGMVYQAFINNGYSPNQARAITAEVGRENDFNPNYLFGSHWDSNRTNIGMISWNQGRCTNLLNHMKQAGLLNKDNTFPRTQAALDEQVKFLTHEIKTNKAYEETKRKFLNNPDVDYATAQRVLGKNFIRWDYTGKASLGANAAKHHAKRDKYYTQLGGMVNHATPNNHQTNQTNIAITSSPDARSKMNTSATTTSTPYAINSEPILNLDVQENQPPLIAQNTDIKNTYLSSESAPNNIAENWSKALNSHQEPKSKPFEIKTDRNEDWRIKPLEFATYQKPDYTQQLAAAFGEVPDTSASLPDYISELARTIYDNV